jgi:hypothetical protein
VLKQIKLFPQTFSYFLTLVHNKNLTTKRQLDLANFAIDFIKNNGNEHFYTQLETIRILSYAFKEKDFPENKYCEIYEACLDNTINIV